MESDIAHQSLVHRAKIHVVELLSHALEEDLRYHSLEHTLQVHDAACELGKRAGLSEDDMEIIALASLFHDTGFTRVYEGHEEVSKLIAREFLQSQDYPADKLEQVLSGIDATHPDVTPQTTLTKLVCDADLFHLAEEDYYQRSEYLRHEWEVYLGQKYKKTGWIALNLQFFTDHQYYSEEGREKFGPGKASNLKQLEAMAEKRKAKKARKKKKKKKKKLVNEGIQDSRSAQMIFKTALRNHLDLANLADNKANIMLSVNALIITLVVPLGLSRMGNHYYQLIPFGTLLLSCLASMIFATMATRPIKMKGSTQLSEVKSGKSNLFFFGNFYRMSFKQYKEGMEEVIADERMLDDSIFRDLFFLGKSLGNKYYLLRVCYTVFMVGITLTVIAFGATFVIFGMTN